MPWPRSRRSGILISLFVGGALAVFAWSLLRVLPRPNSATRFAVWFTALLATAFLPLLHGPKEFLGTLAPAAQPLISVPASWACYLFLAWSTITAIALLRVSFGFVELRRLRRCCRAIEPPDPAWQATIARLCPARRVEILTSDRIQVPTALGFLRPAVVIPAALRLSPAELNHVLLHELAHLRRWDDWTNLVQKFLKALLFFHPAVWWMENRISLEREMACDDTVLSETGSPRAYAECLATLAEKSLLRRGTALAQAAVNRVRQTTLRVAQILDVNRPQAAPARKSAVVMVGLFACACLAVAPEVPRLVSFQDEPAFLAAAAPAAKIAMPVASRGSASVSAGVLDRAADVGPTLAALKQHDPVRRVIRTRVTPPQSVKPVLARARAAHFDAVGQADHPFADVARTGDFEFPRQQAAEPRVIPASTKAASRPAVTTGVLIIVVDDPVFGPTPFLYRFAIWHVLPARSADPAVPQKKT